MGMWENLFQSNLKVLECYIILISIKAIPVQENTVKVCDKIHQKSQCYMMNLYQAFPCQTEPKIFISS